ncbi:MAG TPA: glycosyltransferase family 9 protein [Verrucomicrobiae bacterium]|nr:glycosyltransferase family 9 protein [Verrucomicrobiae bacterium]
MLKSHSAGVGDILRGSAAWRALLNRFPGAALHLWLLTREPGYVSEQLMREHHLLRSFHASDKRTNGLRGWYRLVQEGIGIVRQTRPELIIDFEPNGCRTSLLASLLGAWCGAATVGIAQVPLRGVFYQWSARSTRAYARSRNLSLPLEYAERDFVALVPLGIERNGTAIELRATQAGEECRQRLRTELGWTDDRPLLGVNAGCGTADAVAKRPDLDLLAGLITELQRRHDFRVVLTGAKFEREINRELIERLGDSQAVVDLAGRTSIGELTGVIAACRLFVSSDSGPYHMAVGLRVPTLAIFRWPNPQHYHHQDWIKCCVAQGPEALPRLLEAAEGLLRVAPAPELVS